MEGLDFKWIVKEKGCIKLHPKSAIPNSLYFFVSIPEMKWSLKFYEFVCLSVCLCNLT